MDKKRWVAAITMAGTLTLGLAVPAGAAGPGLTHYTVRDDTTVVEQLTAGDSPCGTEGTATMVRHRRITAFATESGLSDADVLALLDDDHNGVLQQLAITTTGTIVLETGGHTYEGTFTETLSGRFLTNGMYLDGVSFSARLTSELGTLLLLRIGAHDVDDFDGTLKVSNFHAGGRGCLP